uniref:Protocadherin-like wing polarity protein stan n=1 Tax=Ascaris lumbricoides TaxID=6252 RepID=A0A9J2P375_ASCLU
MQATPLRTSMLALVISFTAAPTAMPSLLWSPCFAAFFTVYVSSHLTTPPHFVRCLCDSSCSPQPDDIIWLPTSYPPCLHRGQPLLLWNTTGCKSLFNIHSRNVSLDVESGLLFTERRVCFYSSVWHLQYSFECVGSENAHNKRTLQIGHRRFSRKSRNRRWLRRRNPTASPVHFQQDRYVVEVAESAPVTSLVTTIHATNMNGQPLHFSLAAPEDSRSANLFTLDTVSGEIRVAKPLDREMLDTHVLKVTAYERLEPFVSASTTVIVDVLDVQDNAPIFEINSYFAEVREDAPVSTIGTTVASVFARDLDAGLNGEVEYSLSETEGSNLLRINPSSGVIQTAAELDRETLDVIRLSVFATDKGDPPMSSSALVEITILDVNDNCPVFEMGSYNVTIMENITLPAMIIQLKATDADFGENGKVHYSIVASGASGFSIDYDNGMVFLREKLDTRLSPVSLIIRAKDSSQPAQSSTVTCTVYVADVNDHAPLFVASQQQIFIDENTPLGHEVGRVFAVDQDVGTNGIVRYSLDEGSSSGFEINAISGSIKIRGELDREKNETHILKVRAKDGGDPPLSDTIIITIHLRDVNDNAPYFEPDVYNVTVPESTPRGAQIISVTAKDDDKDQRITYKIQRMDRDIFTLTDLGEQGALLSLSDSFRNTDDVIEVIVSATDQGGLKGMCTVFIVVSDVNAPPSFLTHPFTVRISEHSAIGSEVIHLQAEDGDRGTNAMITYTIDSPDFAIDEKTGLITVASDLDREVRTTYVVNVTVQDHASPPLTASTTIEIILEDVNDNAPVFSSSNYTMTISEDTPVGTSFMQITATDLDAGSNAFVDYFIDVNDKRALKVDAFKLDRSSGTLRVHKKLDREQNDIHVIPVIARDRGNPSLSSSATVTVVLSDVNDNAPQFESCRYDLWIAENSPIGTVVGTIVARDRDVGHNARIHFKIFGGVDAKLFDIEADPNQEGVVHILSRKIFDYEAKNNKFYLEIQASSGQLSSTVPIYVHVSDVNDNKPQLRDFVVAIASYDGESFDPQIGTVPAFDPDHNATLEFHVESNDVILVDRFSGALRTVSAWRRHIEAHYKACVSDGPNTACAMCHVIYTPVDESSLRESVTARIDDMNQDEFLDYHTFRRFITAISLLDRWYPKDVHVFSVHSEGRLTNVTFFVRHKGRLQRSRRIQELIRDAKGRLNDVSGMNIDVLWDESCASEPCPYYQQCRQVHKYLHSAQRFKTDSFLMRSLDVVGTFTCECSKGFAGSDALQQLCNERIDQCYSSPCHHQGTCIPLENGYRCDCPPGRIGTNCEGTIFSDACLPHSCFSEALCAIKNRTIFCENCKWAKHDTDELCRLRSLAFTGEGYVALPIAVPRMEFKIEFSLATTSGSGVVLFAGDLKSDFLEVSLEDALLGARFSLGKEIFEGRMEDWRVNKVNDGNWHKVTVDFYDHKLVLSLDACEPYISMAFSNTTGYGKCATEVVANLPEKCADGSVTCHRFLDVVPVVYFGARPGVASKSEYNTVLNDESLMPVVQHGYTGCISNLSVDGLLYHFSSFSELSRSGVVLAGCKEKREVCSSMPCHPSSRCENYWGGHHCRCEHQLHTEHACSAERPSYVMLDDEESYVMWKVHNADVFRNVSLEFRTRSRDTQVIAVEFVLHSDFITFSLAQGYGVVTVGRQQFTLTFPYFSDGKFKAILIGIDGMFVRVLVDYIHEKRFPLSEGEAVLGVRSMYSGLAPSMSHPQRFEGCLRNVKLNNLRAKVVEQSRTKSNCQVRNECGQPHICPRNSRCIRDWDRHRCHCLKGYIGDNCTDACAFPRICAHQGFCSRSNNSYGYECRCADGFTGRNCERKAVTRTCPLGWYGKFPHCRECECDVRRGFIRQCDEKTGTCLCEPGNYFSIDRCVPCECGFGSSGKSCSALGQCQCTGEALGRRCDRCAHAAEELDRQTLKCVKVHNRCPSNIEQGIQWPTTVHGVVARQSCSFGETGIALRKCGNNGKWEQVNSYNCTFFAYQKMADAASNIELAQMLANATNDRWTMRGINLEIANDAVKRLLDAERKTNATFHVRTEDFTRNILQSLNNLASVANNANYVRTSRAVLDIGAHLRVVHERNHYLNSFFFSGDKLVFSIDTLSQSDHHILPRFANFVDDRTESLRSVTIQLLCSLRQTDVIFYAIFHEPKCHGCENSIVAVLLDDRPCTIRISFPVVESNGWTYPECVRLGAVQANNATSSDLPHPESKDILFSRWSSEGSTLAALNSTHVVCQFQQFGVFTIFMRTDRGALIRFTLPHSIPYTGPLSAAFALLLTLLSASATICRGSIRTRIVRFGFIISFLLDASTIFFIHRIPPSNVFCPVQNAVVSFCTSALFAWLFLYALRIYCFFLNGYTQPNLTMVLVIGIIVPVLLSSLTFFFAPGCSLRVYAWFFWILVTPIILLLLTAFCVAYNTFGLFLLYDRQTNPLLEAATNVILVLFSAYLFLWSGYFGRESVSAHSGELWVNDASKAAIGSSERQYTYAAIKMNGMRQWMPDIIPSATCVHQERPITTLPRPNILSPATKVLHHEPVYGNVSIIRPISSKFYHTSDDDMEHAYGSYTSKRFYPSSTFTR